MDIVLIAGLWLTASVWAGVATELDALGHRSLPVALVVDKMVEVVP